MQITRMFVPKYKYDIKCPYEMQPEFIIVHNTENDASAMAEISSLLFLYTLIKSDMIRMDSFSSSHRREIS